VDWVKVKCFRTETFAILGYTLEGGVLSSLVLAGQDSGRLVYAGRVEFGVPRRDSLLRCLQALGALDSEIVGASTSRSMVWVELQLSAEVRALAWEPGRALHHAVLRSVRVT
jgi:ATP-dependent DNA ligase